MIDLHSHILPGIDDGVKTEDDAVAFARVAVEDGIRTIIATPHCKEGSYENYRPRILEDVERLRSRLQREQIDLEILPGAEVHIAPDLLARIEDGRAPTLGDNGKTLLLELSLRYPPVELNNLVFHLHLSGIQILFAHPERIRHFQDDPSRFEEVVRLGAWGQITTGSILGVFGESTRAYSEELVRKGLVHIIATDAHNTRGRPPVLREAVETVAGWVGRERAEAMVTSAPRALLDGKAPELPTIDSPAPKRSFLGRWFGRG